MKTITTIIFIIIALIGIIAAFHYKTLWIAHNNKDVVHYGVIEEGKQVTT